MKAKIILIVTAISIISCSKRECTNNGNVSLELINNEINYINIDSSLLLKSEGKQFKDLYSYTNLERKKARNTLIYKLTNNSNKKYYFTIDTDIIDFFGNSFNFNYFNKKDSISIRRMCFLIDNNKAKNYDINYAYSGGRFNYNDDSLNIYFRKYLDIESKIAISKSLKQDELTVKNSFVIYSGEYKIFKVNLYLPIYLEKYNSHELNFASLIIDPKNEYSFRLGIYAKKDFIWNSLPDYKRKEIIDNGYEIFDGVILSNKVPLKMTK